MTGRDCPCGWRQHSPLLINATPDVCVAEWAARARLAARRQILIFFRTNFCFLERFFCTIREEVLVSDRKPNLFLTGGSVISRDAKCVTDSHDQADFHSLFVQSQRRIFGHILTLLPNLADAEEAFQQTCVVILGKADQFVVGTDFVRWACQIAQFEVYNYRRRKQAQYHLPFNEVLLNQIAAQRQKNGDLLDAELDAMRRCVDKLPADDKQLIQDRYARNVTSRELAAELGRPANSVYKAIQRIRRTLRVCIEKAVSRQSHPNERQSSSVEEGQK